MNRFQSWYRMQPVALRTLLTINVVFYLAWRLVLVYVDAANAFVAHYLMLHPDPARLLFAPWQVLTYSFLHLGDNLGGFLHLLFNMLWLFWIGKEYEELHGPHRLLSAYVFGSLGGALLTVLLHVLFPTSPFFGNPVYGASAAVFGVMTTVAVRYPYKSVGLLFIGAVRLVYVVLGLLALDLLFLSGGRTSISAHFGGALFGFLLARAEGSGLDLSAWARPLFGRARTRTGRRGAPEESFVRRMGGWVGGRSEKEEKKTRPSNVHPIRPGAADTSGRRAPQDEVDRILDKISAQGYEALSEEEKRILYEASKK